MSTLPIVLDVMDHLAEGQLRQRVGEQVKAVCDDQELAVTAAQLAHALDVTLPAPPTQPSVVSVRPRRYSWRTRVRDFFREWGFALGATIGLAFFGLIGGVVLVQTLRLERLANVQAQYLNARFNHPAQPVAAVPQVRAVGRGWLAGRTFAVTGMPTSICQIMAQAIALPAGEELMIDHQRANTESAVRRACEHADQAEVIVSMVPTAILDRDIGRQP